MAGDKQKKVKASLPLGARLRRAFSRESVRSWFAHAFSVEKYDESSLSDDDKEILGKLAKNIADKKMTAVAILWFQSHHHLNFLGSQLLVAAQPVLDVASGVLDPLMSPLLKRFGIYIPLDELPKLQVALEKRYSVEYFVQLLEAHAAGDYNIPSAGPETPADNA